MIPPDIAIRLRMQTDPGLGAIAPTQEVTADFSNLEPGQRFQAQIRQPLPENTYRAVVNGREITLSLPETVKAGDVLELVVVDRTSRMLVAQRAPMPPPGTAEGEVETVPQLSPTAQMIGKLLPPSGQQAPPAPLNQGMPLLGTPLPAPGDMAAVLLPRLAQAASQSGLFYEAHQAQWIAGKHTTEALKMEPQARLAPAGPAGTAGPASASASGQESTTLTAASSNAETMTAATQDAAKSVPTELRSLVQQQLDAAATQRVAWQGEIWPGQALEWQIARDAPDRPAPQAPETEKWNTSLALTTPRLGRVQAQLAIAGNTVTIKIEAGSPESGYKLRQHLPALTAALNASGIAVAGVQIKDGAA